MPLRWQAMARDERVLGHKIPELGSFVGAAEAKALAVQLALKGWGQVAPNPLVGAVLVDTQGRLLAVGYHERCGAAHAEVMCLDAAVSRVGESGLVGASLYVTLEPCAHYGRTPPCAERLARTPLKEVIFGALDPNPKVQGRGAAMVNAAGVPCRLDASWQEACQELAEIFFYNQQTGKPFVAVKAAATLDGRLALQGDRRHFLTGRRARAYAHFLRGGYDGIVIGRKTLELDDPTLDVRLAKLPLKAPLRLIVDPSLQGLTAIYQRDSGQFCARVLQQPRPDVVWITRADAAADHSLAPMVQAMQKAAITMVALPGAPTTPFAAHELIQVFQQCQLSSVLLEGGAGLYSGFLRERLAQRLHLFQAAQLWGDEQVVSLTDGAGRLQLGPASAIDITPLDDDWVVEMRLAAGHAGPSDEECIK